MIIERGRDILHNCNKKRRLDAPGLIARVRRGPAFYYIRARLLSPFNLGRLPMNLLLQTLHLVFEAQL